ncbi:hypothetical protein CCO02nite_21500 [Cellulomonas composti]|uniref:Uncharacterized protein n=1 Tax=Cellulomonas composti TaxID=266130 RepID=A0A511JBX6_9CELL|nr:hypothetical protein CCO02nite_21500 [Cellulomonas composti]
MGRVGQDRLHGLELRSSTRGSQTPEPTISLPETARPAYTGLLIAVRTELCVQGLPKVVRTPWSIHGPLECLRTVAARGP